MVGNMTYAVRTSKERECHSNANIVKGWDVRSLKRQHSPVQGPEGRRKQAKQWSWMNLQRHRLVSVFEVGGLTNDSIPLTE